MALSQSALLEVLDALKTYDSSDVVRYALQVILQQLIETDPTAWIGAGPSERWDARTNQRNGTRPKTITTAAGDIDLGISKLRHGSFIPSLLERRRRIDKALFAVIMEAYVTGTSGRRSTTSSTLSVPIPGSPLPRYRGSAPTWTSMWPVSPTWTCPRHRSDMCSSTPPTARPASAAPATAKIPVVSQAVVVAIGVSADGRREVLGFAVGGTPKTARSRPPSCAPSTPAG